MDPSKEITNKIFNLPLVIVGILATAFISAVVGVVTNFAANNSYLEYKTDIYDKVWEEDKVPEGIEIRHQGRKIGYMSVYTIYICNRWLKEPENVKVFFEITEKENKPIPRLITKGLYLPSSFPQRKRIEITEEAQSDKNLYASNIKVIKRTNLREPYVASFIFEGKETPNIKISSPDDANVQINPYAGWIDYWPIGIALLIVSLGVVIALISDEFFFEKRWPATKSRLVNALSRTKNLKLDEDEVDLIADAYKKESKPKNVIKINSRKEI
jgi:hypothetical protein